MSMKIFTLSAVCVLVYGLMIALSGTTGFPEYSVGRTDFNPGEHRQVATAYDTALPPSVTPALQDWGKPEKQLRAEDTGNEHPVGSKNKPIRLFGILFIVVWIFVSVRLLSTD
jgi:hypothetical protein